MSYFQLATRLYISLQTSKRAGEVKLGEKVLIAESGDWEKDVANTKAKYILLGIPEDIGVRANNGVGGTQTLWEPALKALLNVQHTNAMPGEALMILGSFDFNELMQQSINLDAEALRPLVAQIDEVVVPIIQKVIAAGKIPVVIGGGHNNAYPLLKGTSVAVGEMVNCINLDAHSDYRHLEGRHSGNGFRYAKSEGYLDKYAIIGLHENYNAQAVLDDMEGDSSISFSLYEDIFLRDRLNYSEALNKAILHTAGRATGIELDLDCIAYTLSSAVTPCGLTPLQARQYVTFCAKMANAVYLHLPEGAVKLQNGMENWYSPKLVAYLVTDFVKVALNKDFTQA